MLTDAVRLQAWQKFLERTLDRKIVEYSLRGTQFKQLPCFGVSASLNYTVFQ